jgi:hypothetical protein
MIGFCVMGACDVDIAVCCSASRSRTMAVARLITVWMLGVLVDSATKPPRPRT